MSAVYVKSKFELWFGLDYKIYNNYRDQNIVDISGALFILSLSELTLNPECLDGTRDFNIVLTQQYRSRQINIRNCLIFKLIFLQFFIFIEIFSRRNFLKTSSLIHFVSAKPWFDPIINLE